jgi:hypothetical protein
MAATEDTQRKHSGLIPWQPGQSGNPAGRPKGARSKLGEAFIEELHKSFLANGPEAIQRVIDDKPDQYLKVIASLLPKDVNLSLTDNLSELSDDELLGEIRKLHAAIAPFLAPGAGEAGSSQEPAQLH